jgi:hypothetical protein
MSPGIWFGVGLTVGGIIVVAFAVSWFRRDAQPDLGSVSESWVVHHRAGQPHDMGH